MSSSYSSHRLSLGAAALLTFGALTVVGCSSDDGVESLGSSLSDSSADVVASEEAAALAYVDERGVAATAANTGAADTSGVNDSRSDSTAGPVEENADAPAATSGSAAAAPTTSVTAITAGGTNTSNTPASSSTSTAVKNTAETAPTRSSSTTDAPTSTSAPTTSAAPTTTAVVTGPTGPVTSGTLFADPYNSAATWAAANPSDPKAAVIAQLGNEPVMKWFGDWNSSVKGDVATYVSQAQGAGAVPMMVVYNIPDRDCGQHSSGGAASFGAYETWITSFADGLGDGPALIVLEPDALALNGCAGSGRNQALQNAIATIKTKCTKCRVYLDAGHSNWVAPAEMANRLRDAGVLSADGFSTNVSNYNNTGSEQAYGAQVLNALGNPSGIGQVIDTSRNGNGSNGEWCDPDGRAVGESPSLNTGISHVHAFMWVKVPGEADGCIGSAGQFVPQRAYDLYTG